MVQCLLTPVQRFRIHASKSCASNKLGLATSFRPQHYCCIPSEILQLIMMKTTINELLRIRSHEIFRTTSKFQNALDKSDGLPEAGVVRLLSECLNWTVRYKQGVLGRIKGQFFFDTIRIANKTSLPTILYCQIILRQQCQLLSTPQKYFRKFKNFPNIKMYFRLFLVTLIHLHF
jgi:hypothetical protein